MGKIVLFLTCAVFGLAVSSLLAGLNKKPLRWIINMFLCALLVCGGFVCALFAYSRLAHKELSFNVLFADKVSLILGIYIFIVLSIVVGVFVGSLGRGGLPSYMLRLYRSRIFYPIGSFVLILSLAVSAVCAYPLISSDYRSNVVINEVCCHNFNLISDKDENFSDYIELYNAGDTYVDLSAFYISDSPDEKDKFRFCEYYMAPGEYLLIWADGTGTGFADGAFHANFKLSDDEIVILSNAYSKTIDTISIPALPDNVAYTRKKDGFTAAYGTPLKSNDDCVLYVKPTLPTPSFSEESGFYSDDILLEITAKKGADIYYTTDGSLPDKNSLKYSGPIKLTDISDRPNQVIGIKNTVPDYDNAVIDDTTVEKANIIRAVAININGEISEVATGTYFIGEAASGYDGYSVLSIIADPDDLFGKDGICVTGGDYDEWYNNTDRSTSPPRMNFWKKGKMWEREATVQLFGEGGDVVLDQSCGIRVQGNASRSAAVKRFSLFARETYGESRYFDAPLFGNAKTHSVYLRHDNYDMAVHDLMGDVEGVPVQRSIPVVVFLNGERYTLSYIREKYDADYFEEYYGVGRDDLILISENLLEEGDPSGYAVYKEFLNFITTCDASDPAVYEEICGKMDVQSFIYFLCTNLYMNNIDWCLCKNIMLWRSLDASDDGYNDGRWRFCILDVDAVSWAGDRLNCKNAIIDPFDVNLPYVEGGLGCHKLKYIDAPLFSTLIKNPQFKRQFVLTYFDLMNAEFSPAEIEKTLALFGVSDDIVWNEFYRARPEYAVANIERSMGLSGKMCSVHITSAVGGSVTVNSLTDRTEVDGIYPADYPINVMAIPKEGYVFTGWRGDVASDEEGLTVDLTGETLTLEAVFEKEGGN